MNNKISFDRESGSVGVSQSRSPAPPKTPPPSIAFRHAIPQVVASCAALSLAMHAGINMAFAAIMIPQMERPDSAIRVDRDSASWIAAAVAVTTPVGSLLSGPLMDWLGRRSACMVTAVPLFLAWVVLPLAAGPWPVLGIVYLARVLAGVGAGLSTAAGVYVSEVAHPSLRPALLCLNSVSVAAGILLTACLGTVMPWGWMAVVFAATAAASMLALLLLAPESPHWLLSMAPGKQMEQRAALARRSLRRLYKDDEMMEACWDRLVENAGTANKTRGHADEDGVDGEGQNLLGRRVFRSVSVFLQPATAKPMALLAIIFILQQLSGTYVIIFYAVPLFAQMGSRFGTVVDEFGVMVVMSVVRFVMSIVTALLSHRVGRRPMMMVSGLGMAACSVAAGFTLRTALTPDLAPVAVNATANTTEAGVSSVLGAEVFEASWPPLVFVVLFVMFSSLGHLVIPWTLVSELLPLASRGMGSGLLVSLAYLFMFGVVKSFPYFMAAAGARNVFHVFGAMSCVGTVFVFFFLPETLGRSLAEIEKYFVKKSESRRES
ncbi:solute carrier family 2, facilitated glucose transporter member 8-like [Thrips palmi]|uniref:Solute carrier family 2, facilitated glucose transporter member 8-like n=1 Tax=Thrips palmi TaxID=161013 RepID=A0A6P8ZNQ4_THRPL|nr:solute carrier family 2, facilitated glucose transporter member 8-like [Thrips palmi]XP_034242850.1 solute carrier family 2, facilitated glucose transporter member 8-like [Thrips palmi]